MITSADHQVELLLSRAATSVRLSPTEKTAVWAALETAMLAETATTPKPTSWLAGFFAHRRTLTVATLVGFVLACAVVGAYIRLSHGVWRIRKSTRIMLPTTTFLSTLPTTPATTTLTASAPTSLITAPHRASRRPSIVHVAAAVPTSSFFNTTSLQITPSLPTTSRTSTAPTATAPTPTSTVPCPCRAKYTAIASSTHPFNPSSSTTQPYTSQ